MPRFKLTIEYLGTGFKGWQIQPEARTVEGELERVMGQILQQPVDVIGQGRTDAGVHATGQVAHVDLSENIDLSKFIHGVNSLIGDEVQLRDIEEVPDYFHARFDATHREYEYRVLSYNAPLKNNMGWWPGFIPDLEALNELAEITKGEHDFNGFSKFNPENFTTFCEVHLSEWKEEEGALIYRIRANRFLRNMVRRLVGTMVEAARGKITPETFQNILYRPAEDFQTYTAPAKALCLRKVEYPGDNDEPTTTG